MKSLSRELWSSSAKISNAVAIIVAIIFSFCGLLEAQWMNFTPDTNIYYNQIFFVDSLTGYIAADLRAPSPDTTGAILRTTDGGASWVTDTIAKGGLLSVSAIGKNLVWTSSDYGEECHSTDGGRSWRNTYVGYSLLTIQFVDSLDGWLVWQGQLGAEEISGIHHSTNGGTTWSQQFADTADYYTYQGRGYFVDTLHGWAAQYVGVRRTMDGGKNWSPIIWAGGAENMQSVFFLDTLRGWAVGIHGIGKTTDGGVSWSQVYGGISPPDIAYFSVFFVDTSSGWVCDYNGGIMHTTNGGNTWLVQRSDTSSYPALYSIFFLDKNNGWAVGNGIILHTTNGGVTAVKEPSPQPKSFRLMQNYPNPFNPSTTISYELSPKGQAASSYVTLKVYDILGRQVATLVDGKQTAGAHTITWNASAFASGVYFYKLVSLSGNQRTETTKGMILVK